MHWKYIRCKPCTKIIDSGLPEGNFFADTPPNHDNLPHSCSTDAVSHKSVSPCKKAKIQPQSSASLQTFTI